MIEIFLDDLVCPVGKYPLLKVGETLVCTNCGAAFPVVEGIPHLLIDDAVLPEGINEYTSLLCFKEKHNNDTEGIL
jgi:uncharacterized protein YbaR (Trm112 family)